MDINNASKPEIEDYIKDLDYQIAQLKDKVKSLSGVIDELKKHKEKWFNLACKNKNKLHRRNMLVKDLRKQVLDKTIEIANLKDTLQMKYGENV